jgi:hypothetical protein
MRLDHIPLEWFSTGKLQKLAYKKAVEKENGLCHVFVWYIWND